jgi:hypothetical protein
MAVNLIALEVHEGRVFALDTDFDIGSFGQFAEGFDCVVSPSLPLSR